VTPPAAEATPAILFLVGAEPQLHSARRVSAYLERPAELLDLWSSSVVGLDAGDGTGHVAPASVGRLRSVSAAIRRWAQAHPGGLVVAPQDVGLVYRRAIAVARSAGLGIALLPDGVVSDGKVTQRSLRGGAVPAADAVLRALGLFAGVHGVMAASKPDLVLSWGPGWDGVYAARGVGEIADVGNPRADGLDALPAPEGDRLLVCSQPTWHAAIGGDAIPPIWYGFLERLVTAAPEGAVRVRLHPWERDRLNELPVGEATRAVLTSGTTFYQDLGWSSSVLSWGSTTMIEAAGARRPVVSVAVNDAAADLARTYAFMRDPRMVMVRPSDLPDWPTVLALLDKARAQQHAFADDYLVNVGSAAKAAAAALDSWRPPARPR
jgi:hypothetical protein